MVLGEHLDIGRDTCNIAKKRGRDPPLIPARPGSLQKLRPLKVAHSTKRHSNKLSLFVELGSSKFIVCSAFKNPLQLFGAGHKTRTSHRDMIMIGLDHERTMLAGSNQDIID